MFNSIKEKILKKERLSRKDGIKLFESNNIHEIGRLAEMTSREKNGNFVYFIKNRHLNPTNICVNRCRFCAFSRSRGEHGAYEMDIDTIIERLLSDSSETDFSEIHIVGGLHPEWRIDYYLKLFEMIKKIFPNITIKALTVTEIDYYAKRSGISIEEALILLKKHGLDIIPGGGAEIFSTVVRNKICPEKISGERYLEIMEIAHSLGIKSNATMLYGHIESIEDRIDHLISLRNLQDRTGGFQAFIPLPYHPENTGLDIQIRRTSSIDDLKTIAISRLMLDNFDHIKAYWVMLGEKISQIALLFGADDLDGTIIEERISHSAGAISPQSISEDELIHLIRKTGKIPVARDGFYNPIKVHGDSSFLKIKSLRKYFKP